jgi:bacterioferritin-associated ferredoxin
MIVCLCEGVTEGTVRKLARQGASSVYEVGLACSAGACCGACRETLVQILRSENRIETTPSRELATAS